jgi:hypothetical protein
MQSVYMQGTIYCETGNYAELNEISLKFYADFESNMQQSEEKSFSIDFQFSRGGWSLKPFSKCQCLTLIECPKF